MELYIPPIPPERNPVNGRFNKGRTPHNKGKKWSDYMDGRKAKRVMRIAKQNLRPNYNIGGWNKKAVIMVDEEGNHAYFESAEAASRETGITATNIRRCCRRGRKRAGGYRWFWFEDNEWVEHINNKANKL